MQDANFELFPQHMQIKSVDMKNYEIIPNKASFSCRNKFLLGEGVLALHAIEQDQTGPFWVW